MNRLAKFVRHHWRKVLILPPIAIGVGVLALSVSSRRSPQQEPIDEVPRVLSVTEVQQCDIRPRVNGYGLARPARTWRAVARVQGTVLETHANLNAGAVIPHNEILVRIDPTDYELQIDQLLADADALKAQILETEQARDKDQETLKLEEESLLLFQNELARQKRLKERNAASMSAVEQATRETLIQRRAVQSLQKTLSIVPAHLSRLRANLEAVETRLAGARLDLDRTVIRAPFDCRLASVAIETGQYVSANEKLFEVQGVQVMEIEARLPIDDLHKLIADHKSVSPQVSVTSLESLLDHLTAVVRVRSGEFLREWPAELARIREDVDARSRTMGVVVEVTRDDDKSVRFPPLLEGTFCEVEFAGGVREQQLLVPAAAIRNHQLFVVNSSNRLETRNVQVVMIDGERMVVQGAVQPGERVVVGDPAPAVEGMLVTPIDLPSPPADAPSARAEEQP